jgi:hypothetical protein
MFEDESAICSKNPQETALRAFYVALYGASRKNKLPRVPGPLHALARANPAGSVIPLKLRKTNGETMGKPWGNHGKMVKTIGTCRKIRFFNQQKLEIEWDL